jgi:hypothetical protein
MGNGFKATSGYTGQGRFMGRRFTGITFIFQLFLFSIRDHGYGFIPNGIIGVLIKNLKNIGWTGRHTFATAIAFVCIDGNEKIA